MQNCNTKRNEKWGMSSFLVLIVLTFLFLSCDRPTDRPTNKYEKGDTCDLAVIVYIAAENSLGEQRVQLGNKSFAELDIEEMVAAASCIPLSKRLLVYYDTPEQPKLYEINRQQGKVLLETRTEENSADPKTFEKVLKEIMSRYPSKRQALVMWSHASGWIPAPKKSFGIDNLTNSQIDSGAEMEIADMRQALDNLGIHFEYIMFDACFMQCIETAYELRHHADYIIASPAEIPGNGAPYNLIMPMMMDPSEAKCMAIADTYYDYYKTNDGCVLSVIKTSEMEALLAKTRELCPDFYTLAYDLDTYDVQPYCSHFAGSGWKPEYFDMGSVMSRLLSLSDYQDWVGQLDRTVINRRFTDQWLSIYSRFFFRPIIIDSEHIAAVSVFVPNVGYDYNTTLNEAIKETLWYKNYTSKE